MKKYGTKRLAAILLCLLIITAMIPVTALAAPLDDVTVNTSRIHFGGTIWYVTGKSANSLTLFGGDLGTSPYRDGSSISSSTRIHYYPGTGDYNTATGGSYYVNYSSTAFKEPQDFEGSSIQRALNGAWDKLEVPSRERALVTSGPTLLTKEEVAALPDNIRRDGSNIGQFWTSTPAHYPADHKQNNSAQMMYYATGGISIPTQPGPLTNSNNLRAKITVNTTGLQFIAPWRGSGNRMAGKLIMLDNSLKLSIPQQTVAAAREPIVKYEGATTGEYNEISCVLVQNGEIKYYLRGMEDLDGAASGEVQIPLINNDVPDGVYTLQMFNDVDQDQGNMIYTGYCSQPINMTLTVSGGIGSISGISAAPPPTPSPGGNDPAPPPSGQNGWIREGGTWYFYQNGTKKTGWIEDGDDWYYMEPNGAMKTGWLNDGGTWYYLNSGGDMASGWQQVNGVWHEFKSGGQWVAERKSNTGWRQYGRRWAFQTNGGWAYDWKLINGKWYYFDSGGYMRTRWAKVGSSWYYLGDSGAMQTGWVHVDRTWYYMNPSGTLATGWLQLGGTWYCLDRASGEMLTGWVEDPKGTWYWMKGSGEMAAGEMVNINGEIHRFDVNGRWIGEI